MQEWIEKAKTAGFDQAAELNMATLEPLQAVRDACAADKCNAYGRNWTCPPACGTLEECTTRMKGYQHGILLQTVGLLKRTIDTRGYAEVAKRHSENLKKFAEMIRQGYPDCLCLGAGGCRLCETCAYPEPCRFPDKAMSSMEAYGLFVTQVCRDNNVNYYYGQKTIAYTACVLF